MPLGGGKDEHFSWFHSSGLLELMQEIQLHKVFDPIIWARPT